MDEITSGVLNDKLMARGYKGDHRSVYALNVGEKEWYYVSDLRGNCTFDVEIPVEKMSDNLKAIAPDGKVNVKIDVYKRARFDLDFLGKKDPDGYRDALVTFKGSKGTGYGTFSFDYYSHKAADGEMYERIRTLEDFDGEAGWMTYWEHNDPNDYPYIYFEYDDDSNALTGIGVAYEKSRKTVGDTSFAVLDKLAVPLEAVEMDKGAELALTKLNWKLHDSDYLALPIVEKARAERGINDEKPPGSKPTSEPENTPAPTTEPTPAPTPTPTPAPEPTSEPEQDSDEIGIIVNGEELKLDVAPQIEGDRVLVPLRAVFEKLGAEVQWDENTDKVKITGADTKIELSADNTVVMVGDEEKQTDVPARIMNERMLVPMRFLAIELNYNVDWDAKNREVRIEMK